MTRRRDPLRRRSIEHEPGSISNIFPEADKDSLVHLGFTCNLCNNHRTTMLHVGTGNAIDYKTNDRPDKGYPFKNFQVIFLPHLTRQDVLDAVAEAHQQNFHPTADSNSLIIDLTK